MKEATKTRYQTLPKRGKVVVDSSFRSVLLQVASSQRYVLVPPSPPLFLLSMLSSWFDFTIT